MFKTRRIEQRRNHGDQAKRFPTFSSGTGRDFHRLGTDRSSVRSTRPRPCLWRARDVRTRRAYGVAYPSARTNVDRYLWMRMDAVLGRTKRSDPTRRRGLVSSWQEALAR